MQSLPRTWFSEIHVVSTYHHILQLDINTKMDSKLEDKIASDVKNEPVSKSRKKKKFKSRTQRFKEKLPRPDYKPIIKQNELMEKFYKHQSFFEDNEFEQFMNGLRETLPASFRINTFDEGQAIFLQQLIKDKQLNEFLSTEDAPNDITNQDREGTSVTSGNQSTPAAIVPLVWYPQNLGWQFNITRLDLRKSPILQQLHKFLMAETDNGFISRQEAVSMIPPLVLDVRYGHNVLDMCAAPGSKTAQLLEYLKCDIYKPVNYKSPLSSSPQTCVFDDGMVVANDVDNKRCYMLVHQSSRLNSPNCVIINHDAARLPDLKTFDQDGGAYRNLKFDRILCDVPCCGDGTARKNPDIWKKWSVGNSNNFHGMQCKILRRGVELLEIGGLIAYSTCSMNPVEDEAVIAALLRAAQGSVELMDLTDRLRGLKYKPGTSKWTVMNKDGNVIESADKVPPENTTQIYPSLFSPTTDEAEKFCLHKCIRVLPHMQNTGGFFVALLKKTSALPWETQGATAGSEETTDVVKDKETKQPAPAHQNTKKRKFTGFKEDPFLFMDDQDPDWITIKQGYGLGDNFPVNQLLYRCASGKKRSIYLVAKRTRAFIIANKEEPDRTDFVKMINGGMRLFSRASSEAGFRICQDGVNEILPYIRAEIKVPIDKHDLIALLRSRTVPIDSMSCASHIRDKIKLGSFILIYKHSLSDALNGSGGDDSATSCNNQLSVELPLVAWRTEWTVALYVSNTYRVHLCALAGLRIDDAVIAHHSTPADKLGSEEKPIDETDKDAQV